MWKLWKMLMIVVLLGVGVSGAFAQATSQRAKPAPSATGAAATTQAPTETKEAKPKRTKAKRAKAKKASPEATETTPKKPQ